MIDKILLSLFRQLARDTGKAVSNLIFGDSHSTPYRRVSSRTSKPEADLNGFEFNGKTYVYAGKATALGNEIPPDAITLGDKVFYPVIDP